jgi:hypothetical protein
MINHSKRKLSSIDKGFKKQQLHVINYTSPDNVPALFTRLCVAQTFFRKSFLRHPADLFLTIRRNRHEQKESPRDVINPYYQQSQLLMFALIYETHQLYFLLVSLMSDAVMICC